MKTIELKLFSFNELSKESQQVAINSRRNEGVETDFIYDDAYQAVKAFNEIFNLKEGSRSWLDFSTSKIDDNALNLKGLRLRKWLINNFDSVLYKRKFYTSIGENKIINHPCVKVNRYDTNKGARVSSSNFYYSRIQKTNSCVLTGVCYDDNILQPIYAFIDNYKSKKDYYSYQDLENLFTECFENLNNAIESQIEFENSDESIIEDLNQYDFTEEGEIFYK